MNIGATDSYTNTQLTNAYTAAVTVGGFYMFLSFDYLTEGAWSPSAAQAAISAYATYSSQYLFDGKPLVSTFEGTYSGSTNIDGWAQIKAATNCFLMPAWSSIGAPGITANYDVMDGSFSWNAWADGPNELDTTSDNAYISALAGKPYMMPVSPWFYTNLPQYNKNWLWRGDNLWYNRWQEVLTIQPEFVEIITWNDFGESHYIGPLNAAEYPAGAAAYVADNPHDGWRAALPLFIAAYKDGNTTAPTVATDQLVWTHRPNPAASGSDGGTTGNNPAYQTTYPPGDISQDVIQVDAILTGPATVTVQIGSNSATTLSALNAGVNHFSVPFNGQTGSVTYTVSRDNVNVLSVTGIDIAAPASGNVNWNAVVGTS